jgi:hypothetical protein
VNELRHGPMLRASGGCVAIPSEGSCEALYDLPDIKSTAMGSHWHRSLKSASALTIVLAVVALGAVVAPGAALASAAPKITGLQATPSSLSATGGTVYVKGKVTGTGGKCDLTSSPSLAGLPHRFSCKPGAISVKVKIPANHGTATKTYSFKFVDKIGTKSTTATAAAYAAPAVPTLTWSTTSVDPNRNAPLAVSCPTATFCMAGDSDGNVFNFNGTSWSGPTQILNDPDIYNAQIQQISCPTSSFCFALTNMGVVLYNGSWGTPQDLVSGHTLAAVACADASYCVALDNSGNYLVFNGSTWTSPAPVYANTYPTSIACPVADDCVAVGSQGNYTTFDGTSWASPTHIADAGTLSSVSCSSASWCGALSATQDSVFFNGTSFGAPTTIDNGNAVTAMSCPTDGTCLASDSAGNVYTYSSGSWDGGSFAHAPGFVALSCAEATSFCGAVDGAGDLLTLQSGTWSSTALDTPRGPLTAVSCGSATYCAAVDQVGAAATFNGTSWTTPEVVDASGRFADVSCVGTQVCFAIDGGNVLKLTGTTWGSKTDVDGSRDLQTISCPTVQFCAASDDGGNVLVDQNGTWHIQAISGGVESSISCVSSTFCMGTDGQHYTIFNGTTWSKPILMTTLQGAGINQVDCTSKSFCIAAGSVKSNALSLVFDGVAWTQALQVLPPVSAPSVHFSSVTCPETSVCRAQDAYTGGVYTFNGATWSAPTTVDSTYGLISISCPTLSFCEGVDDLGNAYRGI